MRTSSEEAVDWGIYLRLPVAESCRHEDFDRLCQILSRRHFGIVSPHRTFAHHDDTPSKGMRQGGNAGIYAGDQMVLTLVERAPDFNSRQALSQSYNENAWKKLCAAMIRSGFHPLPISGMFTEAGGQPTLEAALIIPGNSDLSRLLIENTAKIYNQDSFIYAGPETGHEVHLFEAYDRGYSGLPVVYLGTPIGLVDTIEDIRKLLRRLYA